jgi:formate dehydrogenase subunit gamma
MSSNGKAARTADTVREIVAAHRDQRGSLLPILHAIQQRLGYLPAEVTPLLAEELNLSRADVHGVATFYHDFRDEPAGRTRVRICRAEACQALGAERLMASAREISGLQPGQTAADGSLTLDQVFCLGNCALGPSIQVNGRLRGRVDEAVLRSVLDKGASR